MEVLQIDPARIEVGKRLRAVDPDRVAFLVETIGKRGLDTPIQVSEPDANGFCRLLAGAHRLAAVRQLNLPTIPAIARTGSADELKLIEIEENLVRNELNELDRATFLAEHQAIYLRLYPATKHGGDRKSDGRKKKANPQAADLIEHPLAERFSAYTARKIGISEDTIHRALRRAKGLPENIRHRIAGTWIADNGTVLDELVGKKGAERSEVEQHQLLDVLLADNGTRSVEEAKRRLQGLPPKAALEKQIERLTVAWFKAPQAAREDVLRTWLTGTGDRPAEARRMVRGLLDEAEGRTPQNNGRVS